MGRRATGQRGDRWLVRAPAKLNLYLAVLGERADGYHELLTLLVAVDLSDTLLFRSAPGQQKPVELRCNVAALEAADNLVLRAIELMRARCGVPDEPLSIWLHKRIPSGAGLGGGSSDAAATLRTVADRYGVALSREQLVAWSATLGSDCPFFAAGEPAAVARGRGERLTAVRLRRKMDIVVHWPGVHVATGDVFARATPRPAEESEVRRLVEAIEAEEPAEVLVPLLRNDLLEPACSLAPVIGRSVRMMRDAGLAATMTGSGSAVFGIARNRQEAIRVGKQLRKHLPGLVTIVRNLG